ncbi:chondroitinase-B domain-containing protein [Undibacterium sp. Ren11W]|uniref:chondroitinase-B domain-containing protein n=1 Tax=Undibacterium sp. Ren11W TaxID=3413045 RepID=UPI003BF283B3
MARFFAITLAVTAASLLALAAMLSYLDRAPAELANYLQASLEGSAPFTRQLGLAVARHLYAIDRAAALRAQLPELKIGAQTTASNLASSAHLLTVSSVAQARAAIAQAQAGDVINFLPGTYVFSGENILLNRAGRKDARITLRAAQAGSVQLEFSISEGFRVSEAYWLIENLQIRGNCVPQELCEHAIHVVGKAQHFIARNNTMIDFNSAIKINSEQGQMPDEGELDHNSLSNHSSRNTARAVTVIDLVAASGWHIHHNLITDFIKMRADQTSYGVFVKGGGANNRITQNIVICEHTLRNRAGHRVGLSLGGGGTDAAYCRDQQCRAEQTASVIANNLVIACSDEGIYLNKASASRISQNTLIDTLGIGLRFPETSAVITGNLVDGEIRAHDTAVMELQQNEDSKRLGRLARFVGYHPQRDRFRDLSVFDLAWRNPPAILKSPFVAGPDLCGTIRSETAMAGAFDDFSDCLLTKTLAR